MVRKVRVGVMGAGDGSQKLKPIIEYKVLPKVREKCFSIGKAEIASASLQLWNNDRGMAIEDFKRRLAGADGNRTWPSWTGMVAAMPGLLLFSGGALVLAAMLWGPDGVFTGSGMNDWIMELSGNLMGLVVIVLPGQAFFILAALVPALLSARPWKERLGLRRPAISTRTWLALALATPTIQVCSALFASLFFDLTKPSSQLEQLSNLLLGQSGLGLVLVVLCAAVLPGLSEELFFRGFVREGLSRRHGFALAILVPAVFFAAAHMDPMHATAVLPLGIWFGLIAWWTRSTIPAMLAHAINNAFAILAGNIAGEEAKNQTAIESISQAQGVVVAAYGLSLVLLIVGLLSLRRERSRGLPAPLPPG
jgi:membrane protease YdiL (CAAX protease family)